MGILVATVLFFGARLQVADKRFFGVYYHDQKIGYRVIEIHRDQFGGQPAIRREDKLVTAAKYLGARREMTVDETVWSTPDNRPLRDLTVSVSGNQKSTVDTMFGARTAEIDDDEDGKKTHQSIPIPEGAFFGDMLTVIRKRGMSPLAKFSYWKFDPGYLGFSRVDLKNAGSTFYRLNGKEIPGIVTEAKTRGITIRNILSPEGDLVRQEWSVGAVEIAESEQTAIEMPDAKSTLVDLVLATSLKPDKRIDNVTRLETLKLYLTGFDLSGVPSDDMQTVTKYGDGWVVDVHPTHISDSKPASISDVKIGQPSWAKPSEDLPSDDPNMVELAGKITKKCRTVTEAAAEIMRFVHGMMKEDYGFGMTRDAVEVLRDKRGSCVDYSVLTTTLLRAAGIPSRIASGLLITPTYHLPNTIVYHAWSEYWDGQRWIGADSTMFRPQLTAAHLKLCEGGALEGLALVPADPAKVTIQLLDYQPK
jgi:transglutaminase superfamily protein